MRDVHDDDLMCTLTNDQLDHVSLGLEQSFGIHLAGDGRADEPLYLVTEENRLIALDPRSLTVSDVWKAAEALSP